MGENLAIVSGRKLIIASGRKEVKL